MDKKTKGEFVKLISQGFQEVMIPTLEDMEERLASKKEVKELGVKIDSLDRKFDAQQNRLDGHDKRITKLEEKAGFAN